MAAPLRPLSGVERLEDLYEHAPCGLLSLTPSGRISKANARLAAWLGYERGELAGLSFNDVLMAPARIFYESHLVALLRIQGSFDAVALDLKTKDGGKLPVIAAGIEKRDPDGAPPVSRLALFRATERRQFERTLIEARTRAEQEALEHRASEVALRARLERQIETTSVQQETVAILRHELSQPVAAIVAGVQALRRGASRSASDATLDLIEQSARRLSRLVQELRNDVRGRLGFGIEALTSEPQPVAPAIAHVLDEVRAAFPERTIDAELAIDAAVRCDPDAIARLASNLLGCAIAGGGRSPSIRFNAFTRAGSLVISVMRQGTPLSDDAIAALFSPASKGEAGIGQPALALVIAADIARAHGGTLTIDSTASATTLTFRMPVG